MFSIWGLFPTSRFLNKIEKLTADAKKDKVEIGRLGKGQVGYENWFPRS